MSTDQEKEIQVALPLGFYSHFLVAFLWGVKLAQDGAALIVFGLHDPASVSSLRSSCTSVNPLSQALISQTLLRLE